MRLSCLVVATILFAAAALRAQHTSASGGSSSGHSTGSASSHASSSGGAVRSSGSSGSSPSHRSSTGSSHPSAGSAGSQNSGSPAAHVANAGAAASHTSVEAALSKSNDEQAVRELKTTAAIGKRDPLPADKLAPSKESAAREKIGFWHHFRKRKPREKAEIKRPVPCWKGPCAVCPPGEFRNGKRMCGPVIAANRCAPGQFGNGSACALSVTCQPGTFWDGGFCTAANDCAFYNSRAGVLANELRGIRSDQEGACSRDPGGQQCSELTTQHDGALSRYRGLLNESPATCRVMLPDPASL
jgi:hypothetical protein